jgi:hypothetical protein
MIPVGLGIAAITLYPILFPEAFASFMTRWTTAAHEESAGGGVFARGLAGFTDFLRLTDVVPPLGVGLGFGGNAATLLGATVDGVQPGLYAETDYSRQMVDLGVVCGLAYILFRIAFAAWLFARAANATRRASDPLPMLLFAYAGYVVLLGQITGNGSINVYAWMFTGFCLAACRVAGGASPLHAPVVGRPAR